MKIDKNKEFKKTYNLLLDRIKYKGHPIEEVIKNLGVAEYEISEGSNLFGEY